MVDDSIPFPGWLPAFVVIAVIALLAGWSVASFVTEQHRITACEELGGFEHNGQCERLKE